MICFQRLDMGSQLQAHRHLMLALKLQKKNGLAQEVWANLDLERLESNLQGLTYREKLELEQLKREYRETTSILARDLSK